jgi:hypothetical protein
MRNASSSESKQYVTQLSNTMNLLLEDGLEQGEESGGGGSYHPE